jgi:tRNA G10  N-methylase Trm11
MNTRRPAGPQVRRATATSGPLRSARMFAFAVPGIGQMLAEELQAIEGVQAQGTGFDGRSDVVSFTVEPRALKYLSQLRLAEDIFVEAGRTLRSEGDRAHWITGRLLKPERTRRALDVRGQITRPARERASYRVIVRVLQEQSFQRTELRRQLSAAIAKQQPQWRFDDPADLELWVLEYQPGKILAGFRASDARMRQHDGRAKERRGALRPTVAAAMVRLAGRPGSALLDPCCGSGTILNEALSLGWKQVYGTDVDPHAIETARHNIPAALLAVGDARHLSHDSTSMDACVSNLPFGQQYEMQEDTDTWLRKVLTELTRVTAPGGRVVLLAPAINRAVIPGQLRLANRTQIRLLGTKTSIWCYDRREEYL